MEKTRRPIMSRFMGIPRPFSRAAEMTCLLVLLTAGVGGCAPGLSSLKVPAKAPAGLTELRRSELPDMPLRGYGSLGGEFVEYALAGGKGTASVLRLRCATAEKAGITLGKYRSDLRSLGGVTESTVRFRGNAIPVALIDGCGAILAARQNRTVVIVTAPGAAELDTLLDALKLDLAADLDFSGAAVPYFLDKFDRWGFGFWCNPPLKAPEKQEATYDVREKFDWAKKMGVGLQIDVGLNQTVSAAGIIEDKSKRWAIELAREMRIPVTVQMQGAPAPQWIANRFADEMQMKVPQFIGNWYGIGGFNSVGYGSQYNTLGWISVKGKDQLFADLYQSVRRYGGFTNVLGYGEWHGEVGSVAIAKFMDYGPVADARYRDWLRGKYSKPATVDQRWSGGRGRIKNWDDIRLPEPAEFLGWGEKAVDLKGEWRRELVEKLPAEAKDKWDVPDLDDSGWQKIVAPGDDRQVFREKRGAPTIFQRTFELTEAQLARVKVEGKCWLYAWTLEGAINQTPAVSVNGRRLPASPYRSHYPWAAFEVGGLLHSGTNHVALLLPWGELSYRVYLSPEAPRCYPDLGPEQNARWVDYCDFIAWLREDGLRRSVEAIRREDPDKAIKFMAPHDHSDIMKILGEEYGCYFHDTGGMTGNWNDRLPSLARSSGLPFSLEPGNPAYELSSLKSYFSAWLTEGVNAIDYFMDIGDILWRPDQKAWFEARQPLVHLFGKYHGPRAEVAVLEGVRSQRLTGFPWDSFDTPLLWNTRNRGLGTLGRVPNPRDLINESDFFRGNADRYKVIIDDATLVMDEALIDRIEAWVRAGGIFVTQGHTGRHTPEIPDAWPINRLTGYKPVGYNDNSRVAPVDGQTVFSDPAWSKRDAHGPAVGGAGVFLEKVAPECQDILIWADGKIAMGMRPLGKGKVIAMGTGMPNVASGWTELLKWCGVDLPPAADAPGCRTARRVSNNGLYDVIIVSAAFIKEPASVTLTVPGGQTTMRDVLTGATLTGVAADGKVTFAGVKVEPLETYAFLAPRPGISAASLDWLELQRDWWKGTRKPAPAPKLKPWNNTLPLGADWAFRPLPSEVKDPTALAGTDVDDHAWGRMDIGVWYGTKYPDTKRGIFRKRFSVPDDWRAQGQTWLWIRGASPGYPTLPPRKMQVYLDGKPVTGGEHGYISENITARLTPGEHTLAVATETLSVIGGIIGNVWLEHVPEPVARQSLAGDWNGVQLPGKTKMARDQVRRTFVPDPAMKGKRALLWIETEGDTVEHILLNGRLINRDFAARHAMVDITPFLQYDRPNDLSLMSMYSTIPTEIKTVEIRYYDPDQL
jgi:hypothetical protein